MKLVRVIIVITTLYAVIMKDVSFVTMLLLLADTAFLCYLTVVMPVKKNYAKYLILFILWMSVLFMPSFHLISVNSTMQVDELVLTFGAPILFFCTIISFLLFKMIPLKLCERRFIPTKLNANTICTLIISSSIILSLFSFIMGIGRMGGEAVQLPFHLSGVINVFRWTTVPFLMIGLMENAFLRGRSLSRKVFLLYSIWCVIEIFAWMSKSIFMYHMAPLLLLAYFYYKPSIKQITKVLMPIIIAFLLLYPVIELMRYSESDESLVDSFSGAMKESRSSESDRNLLMAPLNRTFMFGTQYARDLPYINTNAFFDFSKLPLLFFYGGAAGFQTFYIDKYPEGAIHSSGTSGLMDPLLHGGVGLVYVVFFLLLFLANVTDKLFAKGYYSIAVILLLRLFDFGAMINVSSLYDSSGIQTILVELICICILYKMNFKNLKKL